MNRPQIRNKTRHACRQTARRANHHTALEAGLFVHARSLEVTAGYPNLANTSTARLGDESIQQCARVAASSICLIDQAGVYRCLVLAVRRKAPVKTQKAYSLMIGISTKTAMIATIPITRAMRNPQCICNPQGHAHSASKLRSM
jgi:hypothetical protein